PYPAFAKLNPQACREFLQATARLRIERADWRGAGETVGALCGFVAAFHEAPDLMHIYRLMAIGDAAACLQRLLAQAEPEADDLRRWQERLRDAEPRHELAKIMRAKRGFLDHRLAAYDERRLPDYENFAKELNLKPGRPETSFGGAWLDKQ